MASNTIGGKTMTKKCEGAVKSTTSPRPLNETDTQRKGNTLSDERMAYLLSLGSEYYPSIRLAILYHSKVIFSYEESKKVLEDEGLWGQEFFLTLIQKGWLKQIEIKSRSTRSCLKYRVTTESGETKEVLLQGFFYYTKLLQVEVKDLNRKLETLNNLVAATL